MLWYFMSYLKSYWCPHFQVFQSCTPVCDSQVCKHPMYDTRHKKHAFHLAFFILTYEKSKEYEGSHYAVFSSILLFLPSYIQTFSSLLFSKISLLFVPILCLYMPKVRWKCCLLFPFSVHWLQGDLWLLTKHFHRTQWLYRDEDFVIHSCDEIHGQISLSLHLQQISLL